MHTGHYIFTQITVYLPQRQFRRIVKKYPDKTEGWNFSHWNHLLVLMFGQLLGCGSLRELTDITTAHAKRSYNLGFGATPVVRNTLSKANMLREPRIFEEFAFYMVSLAQHRRIAKEFELHGRFYAVDSTIINLCMSVFRWALFRSTKSGIKIHTQIDIITEIPVFYRITNAKVSDYKAMDWIDYESNACYIFDRGYFDLARLFRIHLCGAFFVIREKGKPVFEVVDGEEMLEGKDGVLLDQTIRFTREHNAGNYPTKLRRIVYYAEDLGRSFVYYTNSTLPQKTSHCFIVIDGRLSFFSSGSSSISVSSVSGVTARMPCVYRFTSPLSPTVLLPLLSTTSSWADLSSKLCAYWAAPCWLRMTSWNFSDSGRTIWTIVDKWN